MTRRELVRRMGLGRRAFFAVICACTKSDPPRIRIARNAIEKTTRCLADERHHDQRREQRAIDVPDCRRPKYDCAKPYRPPEAAARSAPTPDETGAQPTSPSGEMMIVVLRHAEQRRPKKLNPIPAASENGCAFLS